MKTPNLARLATMLMATFSMGVFAQATTPQALTAQEKEIGKKVCAGRTQRGGAKG